MASIDRLGPSAGPLTAIENARRITSDEPRFTGEPPPAAARPAPALDSFEPSSGIRAADDAGNPAPLPAAPAYFMFASPSDETGRPQGVRPREIKAAIDRYGSGEGKNIMVGFDVGDLGAADLAALREGRTGDIAHPGLATAAQRGARLHVYVGGPCGETGSSWTREEKAFVREAAKSVGITVKDPANPDDPGTRKWNDFGWRQFTHAQLEGLKTAGFESAEIDNLYKDRHVGDDPTGSGTVSFYREYASWWQRGEVPRLAPKNLGEKQWRAVKAAVDRGELPRGMFSDFAIAEKDVLDRDAGAEVSAEMGITALRSDDTFNYSAFGRFSTPR